MQVFSAMDGIEHAFREPIKALLNANLVKVVPKTGQPDMGGGGQHDADLMIKGERKGVEMCKCG